MSSNIPLLVASPVQPGRDGKGWLSGARDPVLRDGRIGDFWFNELTGYAFGPKTAGGWGAGVYLRGPRGWTPLIRVVTDGTRRVHEVYDWTGGEGTKPDAAYVGSTGFVALIADAADIRGAEGPEMLIDGLDARSSASSYAMQVAVADASSDNEKVSLITALSAGAALWVKTTADAEDLTIPAAVDTVMAADGSIWTRADEAPGVGVDNFRSTDRFVAAQGGTDSTGGGYWVRGDLRTGGAVASKIILPGDDIEIDDTFSQGAWGGSKIGAAPKNGLLIYPLMAVDPTTPGFPGGHLSSFYVSAQTQQGVGIEENTVMLDTRVSTGYGEFWATDTEYEVGDAVLYPRDVGNAAYVCITAGTSSPDTPGPVGPGAGPTVQNKSQDITDGTVHWRYAGSNALSAKVQSYEEVLVSPGGGYTWGRACNIRAEANPKPSQWVCGFELDLFNNTGTDSTTANGLAYNAFLTVLGGTNKNTAHYSATSRNTDLAEVYAARWGYRTVGKWMASDAEFEAGGSAAVAYGVNTFNSGGSHATAGFQDNSTGARGFYNSGVKSTAAFTDTSDGTHVAYVSGGTKVVADANFASTTANGVVVAGVKSVRGIQISATTPIGVGATGTFAEVGFRCSGTAADAGFHDSSTGTSARGFWNSSNKTTGGFVDSSTSSASSFVSGGAKTTSDATFASTAPAGVIVSGTKSSRGIHISATTPIAVEATGTFSGAAFKQTGAATDAGFQDSASGARAFWNSGAKTTGGFVDSSAGSAAALVSGGTKTFADINLASSAPTGVVVSGTKTTADATFASTAPTGLVVSGAKSSRGIQVSATTPNAIDLTGTFSGAGYKLTGTADAGIDLSGATMTTNQILGKNGFSVAASGAVAAPSVTLSDFIKITPTTVGSLPDPAGRINEIRVVTDATSPTKGSIVAGSGAVRQLVICNSFNWIVL